MLLHATKEAFAVDWKPFVFSLRAGISLQICGYDIQICNTRSSVMYDNHMVDYIYQTHGHRIQQWNDVVLNPQALETYAAAIRAKCSPLDNCFGFIDGTVRAICKPGQNQRVVYNGHKRVYAIKFQSVALPNGIIGNMYWPVGKIHTCGTILLLHVGMLMGQRVG